MLLQWQAFEDKDKAKVPSLLSGLETYLGGDHLLDAFSAADVTLTFNLQQAKNYCYPVSMLLAVVHRSASQQLVAATEQAAARAG